jgi:hypothetical protein
MGKSRQTGKLSSDGMLFPSPSNGRVGIGTSVPSETLHIEGSARLTEELYDYNNIAGSSGQVLTSTGVGVSWSSEGVGGDEGAQGAQGTQGLQGLQGHQGLQGNQGLQGTQGTQGFQGTQGLSNQGAQGAQGSQGVKGDNGNFGGASFEYNFDSSETDADPGSGNIRLVRTSGADLTTSTQINIDDNSTNATDISSYLATIDASTSTIKGHLKITKIGDASAFIMYTISAESDQSGYHTITVSSVDNSGVNPFANGDQLLVTFARTGDKGDQGDQGNQGDEGLQGNQGTQGVGSQGLQGGGGQGTQGSQGFQGTQGTQGLSNQGAQGTQGSQGFQGTQGLSNQGAQGTQGTQGFQGTQGLSNQGAQGTQGSQGFQGNQGLSNQGAQGTQGTQGFQGIQGVGSQGLQGLQGGGGQGTQGSQGFQGTQGTQGLSNQGAQGIQGIESGQVTAKEYDVAVSSGVFTIDTVSQPDLYLIRGQKYTFDQSDSTNYNHPLELTLTNGSGYTNGWSSDGNMPADASTSGTRVHTFIVPYDAPDEIFYICNVHGSGMGNSIYISDLTASDLQGLQGLQGGGSQGSQGSQGFQGTQGTQGTQGLGNQGLQGVQGLSVQGAAGTGGGSSGIEIENNGTSVGTGIISINFSTNVTATASGGIATVTASGGGGGGSTTRTVTTQTISSATDTYSVTYDVGYIDVYLNGVRLETGEYTATNGTSIVLNSNTHVGDVIEFVAYSSVNLSSINLSDDTDPELGGDLDLNGHDITGIGNISITGSISANSSTVATQSDAIAFAIALG